jgi:hypothetical protein
LIEAEFHAFSHCEEMNGYNSCPRQCSTASSFAVPIDWDTVARNETTVVPGMAIDRKPEAAPLEENKVPVHASKSLAHLVCLQHPKKRGLKGNTFLDP